MRKQTLIMAVLICGAAMTGIAQSHARDVGPPETASAVHSNNFDASFDLDVIAFEAAPSANVLEVAGDAPVMYVSLKEDPAQTVILEPRVTDKSYYPAFMDRHRRSGNYVGQHTNTGLLSTTAIDSSKFEDRHRRLRVSEEKA